jgi:hypothetical protein
MSGPENMRTVQDLAREHTGAALWRLVEILDADDPEVRSLAYEALRSWLLAFASLVESKVERNR